MMSAAEIEQTKLNLIVWIEQLSDTNTLTFLAGLKDSESSTDWWDDISERQKHQINEGLKDVEAGRVMSSTDFWSRLTIGL